MCEVVGHTTASASGAPLADDHDVVTAASSTGATSSTTTGTHSTTAARWPTTAPRLGHRLDLDQPRGQLHHRHARGPLADDRHCGSMSGTRSTTERRPASGENWQGVAVCKDLRFIRSRAPPAAR